MPLTPPPDFTDYKELDEFHYREEGDGASLELDLLAENQGEGDITSVNADLKEKMMCVEELEPVYTVVHGRCCITQLQRNVFKHKMAACFISQA